MPEEAIKQAWLTEFGDDSHVSLHCYTLAYKVGWNACAVKAHDVRKKTAAECVEVASHQGSQFCIYCGLMLDAIKKKFGLEI